MNKGENSWSGERACTLSILGDTGTSLCTEPVPRSACDSGCHHGSHSTRQCIESKFASHLHEAICMQWRNRSFRPGCFVVALAAPMSPRRGTGTPALGPGYIPGFPTAAPFLPSATVSHLYHTMPPAAARRRPQRARTARRVKDELCSSQRGSPLPRGAGKAIFKSKINFPK